MCRSTGALQILHLATCYFRRGYPGRPRTLQPRGPLVNDRFWCIAGRQTSLAWISPALDLQNSLPSRIGCSRNMVTNDERMQRDSSLIATISRKLPEFAKACADEAEWVLLHQDAFAADHQEDEYTLLGMAIKYAGLRGKEVRVIGRNRSSFAEEGRLQ